MGDANAGGNPALPILTMLTQLSISLFECYSIAPCMLKGVSTIASVKARSNMFKAQKVCCCSVAFLGCGFLQWVHARATSQSGWDLFHFKSSLALLWCDSPLPLTRQTGQMSLTAVFLQHQVECLFGRAPGLKQMILMWRHSDSMLASVRLSAWPE